MPHTMRFEHGCQVCIVNLHASYVMRSKQSQPRLVHMRILSKQCEVLLDYGHLF